MTHEEMERLTAHTDVKSEKIRILFKAGEERADIARFMEVQYQYVHNILKRSGLLEKPSKQGARASDVGRVYTVTVTRGGKIALPPEYMDRHGITDEEVLICREGDGGLVIMSRDAAADVLREAAKERMPAEAALLEALLDRIRTS